MIKKGFIILLVTFWTLAVATEAPSPWLFELGVSLGSPTPLTLLTGVRYRSFYLRGEGLANYKKEDDFWCGGRGSLGYDWFAKKDWGLELGVSGGYAYARAPNGMHRALNEANDAFYLFNNDWEETADISLEGGVRLFGVHSRIEVPLFYPLGNKKPNLLWRLGYIVIF
jgi:hypothetical protein